MDRRRFMGKKGLDEDTLLLLHLDGNTTDSVSGSSSIATIQGALDYSNTAKFRKSITGFSHSDYVNISNTDAINESKYSNYTIDFWLYCTAPANTDVGIFSKGNPTGSYSMDFYISKNTGESIFRIQYAEAYALMLTGWDIPRNQWIHVAIVKKVTTWKLYLNGMNVATGNTSVSSGFYDSLKLGYYRDYGWYFRGCIDEFRISKTARWTNNFTPPTHAY